MNTLPPGLPPSSFASLSPDHHTLKQAVLLFSDQLTRAGVDSPRLSAELLLAKAMGMSRQDLVKACILTPRLSLAEETLLTAWELVRRRALGEPAAYVLGRKEFYGRDFFVTPAVLIPRPETELLVETALALADTLARDAGRPPLLADFGTGSGCIALTMVLERPEFSCVALDKSAEALAVARGNATSLEACNVAFVRADFTASPLRADSLDLLLSNPPYVGRAEYEGLSREVRCFEPSAALTPGDEEGLDALRVIARESSRLLRPGGWVVVEMGCTQAEDAMPMFTDAHFTGQRVLRDLAGHPRLITARKQP